jgi:hypothetical protein
VNLWENRGSATNRLKNKSKTHWRVRVHWANQNLELRESAVSFFLAAGDQRECTGTFTIETHVLGVALGQGDLVAFLDEESHGECITID